MEKQKSTLVAVLLTLLTAIACAQAPTGKYSLTKATEVKFITNGVMTDITATHKKVQGIIDFDAKLFAIKLRIDEFIFTNSLMQKHFLENYLESDKYPESKFTGSFSPLVADGKNYKTTLNGKLTIHGVTQPVALDVTFTENGTKFNGTISFKIKTADYKIDVPDLVFDKVGDMVNIDVVFEAVKI